MARQETITRTLYSFDELDESAKDTARQWYRSCIETDEISDFDDWQTFASIVASILGIEFKTQRVPLMNGTTRPDPIVYWSVNPSEAAFAGYYSYAKNAPKRIREYAPRDHALHLIADRLQQAQRKAFYRITADCQTGGRDGLTQRVECFRNGDYWDSDDVSEALTDFAHWIACRVSAQWDYLHSDENVDDCILANAYEFDESGNIA